MYLFVFVPSTSADTGKEVPMGAFLPRSSLFFNSVGSGKKVPLGAFLSGTALIAIEYKGKRV